MSAHSCLEDSSISQPEILKYLAMKFTASAAIIFDHTTETWRGINSNSTQKIYPEIQTAITAKVFSAYYCNGKTPVHCNGLCSGEDLLHCNGNPIKGGLPRCSGIRRKSVPVLRCNRRTAVNSPSNIVPREKINPEIENGSRGKF